MVTKKVAMEKVCALSSAILVCLFTYLTGAAGASSQMISAEASSSGWYSIVTIILQYVYVCLIL